MDKVVGIALSGGRGERARPITVKAPGYLRSKAAMSFCGRRLIHWLIEYMSSQGIDDFYVIAQGKENRYQVKMLVGHGEPLGVKLRYSRVRFDRSDTGSADATLRNLDYWGLEGPALVFPSDSLFDFSVEEMLQNHQKNGAVMTVAGMVRTPAEVAEKYGVMITDSDGRVEQFFEKPTIEQLRESFPDASDEEFNNLQLPTNAGMYMLDSAQARKMAEDPEIEELRRSGLDFGKDFLPWLVKAGHAVYTHPVERVGDLGSIADYLTTMVQVLEGTFASPAAFMGDPYDAERRIWIPADTLRTRDDITGKTLEEKMKEGLVDIVGNVRLGRYTVIGPGVRLQDCNIDDGIDIAEGVHVTRSGVRDGVILGPHSAISDSYLGSMVEVQSDSQQRTVLEQRVAVGDEVVIQAGVHLREDVSIWPGLKIPFGAKIPPGSEIESAGDILSHF